MLHVSPSMNDIPTTADIINPVFGIRSSDLGFVIELRLGTAWLLGDPVSRKGRYHIVQLRASFSCQREGGLLTSYGETGISQSGSPPPISVEFPDVCTSNSPLIVRHDYLCLQCVTAAYECWSSCSADPPRLSTEQLNGLFTDGV